MIELSKILTKNIICKKQLALMNAEQMDNFKIVSA